MWNQPPSRLCDFAVRCKGCGETIPAPVGTMPDNWIVAACPLCGQRRRYLPSEFSGAHYRTSFMVGNRALGHRTCTQEVLSPATASFQAANASLYAAIFALAL